MKQLENLLFDTEESGDAHYINKMLSYEFAGDNEIWLHIDDVKDESFGEKLRMLRDGFKSLAEILKTYDRFSGIEIISGTSWIVTKNPILMERLGFTIDNSSSQFERAKNVYYSKERFSDKYPGDIAPSYAYISKNKFIELYGK